MSLAIPCSKETLFVLVLLLLSFVLFRDNLIETAVQLQVLEPLSTSLSPTTACENARLVDLECEHVSRDVDQCVQELSLLQDELMNISSNMNGSMVWGMSWEHNKTGGHLETTIVSRDCKMPANGFHVCCAAVNSSLRVNRGVGIGMTRLVTALPPLPQAMTTCKTHKVYHPSKYEIDHLDFAHNLSSLPGFENNATARLNALLAKITSKEEYDDSIRWLARVRAHMHSEEKPESHEDDEKYLSYWEITVNCSKLSPLGDRDYIVKSWRSWIEPLTLHSRHPFAYRRCRRYSPIYNILKKAYSSFPADAPNPGMSNIDYILVDSGENVAMELSTESTNSAQVSQAKHLLLDVGTSTFDSSAWWFTCAYSQRRIDFDAVYGWELTPLQPVTYWNTVPFHWRPYWHFYNVPVKGWRKSTESPLHFLKEIASPRDFVSMKLDIDNPHTEIPLFEQLLEENSEFSELIDEFFFELHYRCEVMMPCGWGTKIPEKINSIKLDRYSALRKFSLLRKKGIRAHFWP